jgi:hypothetical protein
VREAARKGYILLESRCDFVFDEICSRILHGLACLREYLVTTNEFQARRHDDSYDVLHIRVCITHTMPIVLACAQATKMVKIVAALFCSMVFQRSDKYVYFK